VFGVLLPGCASGRVTCKNGLEVVVRKSIDADVCTVAICRTVKDF
jgi:hypothetical protein